MSAPRSPGPPQAMAWAQGVAALLAGLLLGLGAAPAARAQTGGAAVYRCGNNYSSTPCAGGSAVETADPRSAAQQQQAQAVKQRDAAMAEQLAAERHARERAAVGQAAVGIGPTAADAPAPKASAHPAKPRKYKKVSAPAKPASQPTPR